MVRLHCWTQLYSPLWSICVFECWSLTNKSQRNAVASESVGRSGDLSPAGDGDVTMVMVDSWSTLWPLNYSKPEKWIVPICIMLHSSSTLCHHIQREKSPAPARKWKMLMVKIRQGNEWMNSLKWSEPCWISKMMDHQYVLILLEQNEPFQKGKTCMHSRVETMNPLVN